MRRKFPLSKGLFAAVAWLAVAAAPMAARAETTLEVAYIPIMPMAPLYVMEGEGWTKEAGLDLKLTKFSSGPAMVQAIASGKYDVMYFGIGPAMVSRANGVPIKVVAGSVMEQIGLVAQGDFAKTMKAAKTPAEGVHAFTKAAGRKPKIASLPKGSVPDAVFRHWVLRVAGLKVEDFDIVGMGEDKVQQAVLTRSVDAASILEPVVTIIRERLPDATLIAAGGQMFKGQPGAVVAVRESTLAEKRAAIVKLVALHIRAVALIKSDPKRAAKSVHEFLGKGLVPLETIEKAMTSPISNFVANPHDIMAPSQEMQDFSAEIGTLKKPVKISDLYDTSVYDQAVKKP
ncbi:MAG: ABC transporter substrate-binding protein [Candidatus Eiseniibacteriota bacterium]